MINGQLTIDLIRKIIVHEIDIDPKRAFIYGQKWHIPTDESLFAFFEYKASPMIISSRNTIKDDGADYLEVQDLNTVEDIVIGLFSRNIEALQKKEEAVMAMKSIYSQQLQEINSFRIFPNPRVLDLSGAESTAILYRVDIEVKVFAWYNKIKTADFLDAYRVAIRVNDGTPDLYSEFDVIPT